MPFPGEHAALRSRTLAVELVARAICEEIAAGGGEAILLKGAGIRDALYGLDDPPRLSVDVDLLVPAEAQQIVAAVLRRRGYSTGETRAPADHATTWRREGLPDVDVHDTLGGLLAPPERVWAVLRERRRPLSLAGGRVATLDLPALALHLAVHATQHGRAGGRPVEDLERALMRVSEEDWQHAYRLALQLDGLDAFSTGLRLTAAGRQLADRLGLPEASSALAAARAENASSGARLVATLSDAGGTWRRLRALRWAIAPPPAVMREWYPKQSLLMAYALRRPARILRRGPRAVYELRVARWRTRRRSRLPEP